MNTSAAERVNDRESDRAVERAVREGLFKRGRRGRFWHRVPFAGLAELRQYLWEHLRFVRRARWLIDASTLRSFANEPLAIRRAVRFELLEPANPRLRRSGGSRGRAAR